MCDVRCCCFAAPAAPSTLRCDSRRSIRDWFASPPPSFSKPCKKCGRMHTFFCSSPSQEKKRLPVARRQLLIASHYEMGTSWSEFCFICFCFLLSMDAKWVCDRVKRRQHSFAIRPSSICPSQSYRFRWTLEEKYRLENKILSNSNNNNKIEPKDYRFLKS